MIWNHITFYYEFEAYENELSYGTPLFLTSLSNLVSMNRLWAFSFLVIFFSIAGIPPASGFLAKIYVIYSLIDADQLMGAIFLIMMSAISVYYYLRVVKVIYFESKGLVPDSYKFKTVYTTNLLSFDSILIAVCLFLLVFFFFYPTTLLLLCQYLVINSFWF